MNLCNKYLLLAVISVVCWAAQDCRAQAVAYLNATIETMSDQGRLDNATLLVRNGSIEAVGQDIEIPRDARRVFMNGATIMPGIIDPYYVYRNTGSGGGTRTVVFRGRTFTVPGPPFSVGSFTRVGDHFYPFETDFMPAVQSGITTANLVTDGRGLSAFADLTTVPNEGMLFEPHGLMFAKLTNQTSALDVIRKGLDAAKNKHEKSKTGGSADAADKSKQTASAARKSPQASADESKSSSQTNAAKDDLGNRWQSIRTGKQSLVINVNNAATISHVLKILKKHEKVKCVLVATGPNLYLALDELKACKDRVQVVLPPGIDTQPGKTLRMNVSKLIHDAGITFAYSLSLNSSQMNASIDDPMFPIAVMVKSGLERDVALQALTIVPARMLGIDKTHGTIEAGKHADLLVFNKDPLATGSRLQSVISNGKVIHESSE